MSLRLAAAERVRPLGRAVVVLGSSLAVAYSLSPRSNLRLGSTALIGGLGALIVPPWVLLAGALLCFRSIAVENILGPVTGADALLLIFLLRRMWVLVVQNRFRFDAPAKWLAVFLAWTWLCTILNGAEITPLERMSTYCVLFMVLATDDQPSPRVMSLAFLGYAVFEIVWSIPSQGGGRLTGEHIGDPHQLSILAFAALAPLTARAIRFRGANLIILLLTAGVLLARSRGPIVSLFVILLLPLFGRLTRRKLALFAVAVLVTGIALYEPATKAFDLNVESREYRELSVERGIRAGLASPFIGNGWSAALVDGSTTRRVTDDDGVVVTSEVQPYNLFVSTFAFTGVPGLVFLLLFLASMLQRLLERDRGGVLFATAFLLLSLTEMTFYAQWLGTVLFFVVCGLGVREKPRAASRPQPASAAARMARS